MLVQRGGPERPAMPKIKHMGSMSSLASEETASARSVLSRGALRSAGQAAGEEPATPARRSMTHQGRLGAPDLRPPGQGTTRSAARAIARMPSSHAAARTNGSETLRAGSTAVLGLHPAAHGEEAASPASHHPQPGTERRGLAFARNRLLSVDTEMHLKSNGGGLSSLQQPSSPPKTPSALASGQAGHGDPLTPSEPRSPKSHGPVCTRRHGVLDATYSDCLPTPSYAASSSRAAAPSEASERTSPRTGGRASATATLISALTAGTFKAEAAPEREGLAHAGRRRSGVERPAFFEPAAPTEEPPSAPLPPSGESGRKGDPRRQGQGLTVSIPSRALKAQARQQPKAIARLGDEEKIFDRFCWSEVLQEQGDGGKVVVCRRKGSPEPEYKYVMKIRSKESLREQYHEDEFRKSQVRMLNFPPHIGVMPLREVLEDEKFYYVIMDRATGGSFFYSLLKEFKDGIMPHGAVKGLIREILEAVSHVHQQGMLHRDIKPDNLVMQYHDDPLSPSGKVQKVMLIDFDHADPEWSPLSPSRDRSCYGTLRFNAPETFLGDYSAESDLYSVGTILYLLMAGKMPYRDEIFEQEPVREASPMSRQSWMDTVYQLMRQEAIDWACSPWPEQPVCRGFCAALLSFDACNRPSSAEEALAHPWLQD